MDRRCLRRCRALLSPRLVLVQCWRQVGKGRAAPDLVLVVAAAEVVVTVRLVSWQRAEDAKMVGVESAPARPARWVVAEPVEAEQAKEVAPETVAARLAKGVAAERAG